MGILFILIWLASVSLFSLGLWYAKKAFSQTAPEMEGSYSGLPVSILKPLCGADEGLYENLESFFRIDYPKFELVFSIADHRDPACEVVRELIKKYPHVQASFTIAHLRIGENPKINNLYLAYRNSRYDLVLISDSNTRVKSNYLFNMIPYLKPNVGLVTAPISGCGAKGLGAEIEANYLSTFLLRWMHLSILFRNPLVMGKSMLFRKRDLANAGGIDALKSFIAEDYATGLMLRKLGLQVVHANEPIKQYLGKFTFKEYWNRHVRWGRIRQSCEFLAFLGEPLSTGMVSGFFGALGFHSLFHVSFGYFWGIHMVLWLIGDGYLLYKSGRDLGGGCLVGWLLGEITTLPLWVVVLCGNSITWRGNRLVLARGGRLASDPDDFHSEPTFMNTRS